MSLKWVPNALTVLRCTLAFVVGWAILKLGAGVSTGLPFLLFVLLGLTDFLDGYLARRLNAISTFGALLDPIADKLLVAISLIALSSITQPIWMFLIPAVAIIARDVTITGLRFRKGGATALPVTRIAKWKTAAEMLGIGGYLLSFALSGQSDKLGLLQQTVAHSSIALIYIAAVLSLYTGYVYMRAAFA